MSGTPVSRESVSVITCSCVEHEPFDNVFACLCLIMLVCTSVCFTFPFTYSVCIFCLFICDVTESACHYVCRRALSVCLCLFSGSSNCQVLDGGLVPCGKSCCLLGTSVMLYVSPDNSLNTIALCYLHLSFKQTVQLQIDKLYPLYR